jgi:hypothetical protein
VAFFLEKNPFEKLIVSQQINKFLVFYAIGKLISGFTRALYWFLFRAGKFSFVVIDFKISVRPRYRTGYPQKKRLECCHYTRLLGL